MKLLRISGILVAAALVIAARAEQDPRPLHVVICLGPGKTPLTKFESHLETTYHVQCSWLEAAKSKDDTTTVFKGLETLPDADVILSNLYRTAAAPAQLVLLKKHFLSKPVVGLRKAHHGFENWLDADKEVFGVDYRGHYFGDNVTLWIADKHLSDPLFAGLKPFLPAGGLYTHTDLAADVDVFMLGGPAGKPPLPQCWTRLVKDRGQRVFYTRYDPEDLQDEGVREMVVRAIFWAGQRAQDELRKKQP